MRRRWLWSWAFLAAAVAAAALSLGPDTASGIHRFPATEAATVTHPPAWPGALQAVLRSDGHQLVESAAGERTASTARLLLVLAWLLGGGAALLRLVPAAHPAFIAGGPPSLTRQRRWIGLRAPPSSQLF